MLKGRPLSLHLVALLVLIFGASVSVFGWWQSESSVRLNDGVLLQKDANQGSLLLSPYTEYFGSTPTALGALVSGIGVAPTTFDAAAAPLVAGGGGIALLHPSGGRLEVLASVGTLHRSFGGPSDAALIAQITKDPQDTYVGAGSDGKNRYISQIYGSPTVPAGFAIYVEKAVDGVPANGIYQIPGQLFAGINGAIFVGSVTPANQVLATDANFSLTGQLAVVPVVSGNATDPDAVLTSNPGNIHRPGQLILVIRARGNLSGSSAGRFPFELLLVGLAASVLVAVLLEMALRRRDYAFRVVQNLKSSNERLDRKNLELDEALTKQAKAEQNLRQAQRMEAVGQLAGGIAHDFNNLLHVILSYSGFLADEAGDNDTMQADVVELQEAAHRAAELTRKLLVFSRMDVTRPTAMDLNRSVTDSERILRRAVGEDVTLTCATGMGDCIVMADPADIDQVLMNLTTNARDAMPSGGTLDIVVTRVEEDHEDAPLPVPYVRVDVRDNGVGMDDEVAVKAFEPFFTTKDTGRGTGLGLSMVYGIVTRWGGTASITTAPGKGTTVTMCLPPASCAAVEAARVTEEQPAPGGHETILLVEDEESVLRSASRILESAGYAVLQAANAAEATVVYNREHVDIVVTDVVMPGGASGKQLADALREERPDLPVVFISGYSAETIAMRGVLPNQTLLVKKPFSRGELLFAIREAVTPEHAVVSS
jgi:signal transduction histidine kinase/ActR/RegA family two-component response regulator